MSFLSELSRRNVIRTAGAYLAGSWLVVQVAGTVLPVYGYDSDAVRVVVTVLAIGFLPALIFAWAFEFTPSGVRLERDVVRDPSITPRTSRVLDRLIILMLVLALCFFLVDRFLIEPQRIKSAFEAGQSAAVEGVDSTPSIAVLPFVNMSGDASQEYFSDGISEELLNLLARIPQLRVISRSSAFAVKGQKLGIKEIGERLHVAHVLEGSVRRSGNKVRITAQLIDARRDSQLWSVTYDRVLDDIFAVQDEIANEVVKRLRLSLVGDVPRVATADTRAYTLYLKARPLVELSTRESLDEAIGLLLEAIQIDPKFVAAWNSLAIIYSNQAKLGLRSAADGLQLAKDALARALTADKNDSAALCALAQITLNERGDFAAAVEYVKRGLSRDRVNVSCLDGAATVLAYAGRMESAINIGNFLAQRDPLDHVAWLNLAYRNYYGQNWDDALLELDRAVALSRNSVASTFLGGLIRVQRNQPGDPEAAFKLAQHEPEEGWRLELLAVTNHVLGHAAESDAALNQLIEKHSRDWAFNIACVFAFRRETDRAFQWLNSAIESGDTGISTTRIEPLLKNLHPDPRWEPFLRKLGQDTASTAGIDLDIDLPAL